jgi:hypothetical protein
MFGPPFSPSEARGVDQSSTAVLCNVTWAAFGDPDCSLSSTVGVGHNATKSSRFDEVERSRDSTCFVIESVGRSDSRHAASDALGVGHIKTRSSRWTLRFVPSAITPVSVM